MAERCRNVTFDLAALLWPPHRARRRLAHYLSRDGIELIVHTQIDRRRAKRALRDLEILPYIDDLISSPEERPEGSLWIGTPSDARYTAIAERTVRADRRVPFADFTVDAAHTLTVEHYGL